MSKPIASDFNVGDNINYLHNGKTYPGQVVDHFETGLFVQLNRRILIKCNNTYMLLSNFDLYNDEETDGMTILNLSHK